MAIFFNVSLDYSKIGWAKKFVMTNDVVIGI